MENDKIKILILAAGKGKRMESDEPKALALLRGKPFLQHILETVAKLHIKIKPVIIIGYKKERIQEVLGTEHMYAIQHEQLGTGHAVASAKSVINSPHETILILAADQPMVSKETLEKIIKHHQKMHPILTLATVKIPDFEDWRKGLLSFGRIVRDSSGKISKIVEAKDADDGEKEIKELNPAVYAFDANWLWANIGRLSKNNAQNEYYLTDLVKMAFEQKMKIESVEMENIIEAMQPNSKEELETLEGLVV